MKIIIFLRNKLKNNDFLFKTVYPFVFKLSKKLNYRPRLIKKYGFEVLHLVNKIANQYQIPYYIDWGTLLGMVRENNFIKHDEDIDFTILPCNVPLLPFIEKLGNSGFIFDEFHLDSDRNRIKEFRVRYKDISIDFFLPYEENGFLTFVGPDRFLVYPKPSIARMTFNNITLNVPTDTENHLEWCYGNNWRTPEKRWNSKNAKSFRGFNQNSIVRIKDINLFSEYHL